MIQLQRLPQDYSLLMQALSTWQELPSLPCFPLNRQIIEPVQIVPLESLPSTAAIYAADWSMAIVQQLQKCLFLLGHGYDTRLNDILPVLDAWRRDQQQLSLHSIQCLVADLQQDYGEEAILEDVVQALIAREVRQQAERRLAKKAVCS